MEDVDVFSRLISMLHTQPAPPLPTYQFDVKRDSRDRLVGITATPKEMVKVRY